MVLQLLLEAGRGSNRFAHLIFGLAHSLQGVDLSGQLVLELNDLRGLVHLKDLVLCCRQAGQIQGTLLGIPLHSSCSCGSHQLQKERKNDWFELCPFLGGRGGGREVVTLSVAAATRPAARMRASWDFENGAAFDLDAATS